MVFVIGEMDEGFNFASDDELDNEVIKTIWSSWFYRCMN